MAARPPPGRGWPPLALAIVAALAATASAAPASPAPENRVTGFDHPLHDRDLTAAGRDAVPCARCHVLASGALVRRPGHPACFGACHGPAPRRAEKPGERRTVCAARHGAAAPAPRASPVPSLADRLAPDFALEVGHRRHRALPCQTCHTADHAPPHRRCAGCHDGARTTGHGPAMTACTGCHTAGVGRPRSPSLVRAEVHVQGAFSHARHAARPDGARCTTCHHVVVDTDDNRLPAPDAASCARARCHDGTAAFPVTAACARCHRDPGDPEFKVARPTARYEHARHADVQLPCVACHSIGASGEVHVTGHAPCARCHADDFGRRQPRICGACHNATEPWRALVADRGPPERTEFGATLDHDRHPGDCARCHALTTSTAQLRPPRGHRACTGAGCHAVTGGPAPVLGDCERCHRRGLAAERQAARLAAPWSVRRAFDHAAHARGADGTTLGCTACHIDLRASDTAALATPPKATCAPCHDGATAFKLTGTQCTRCHQGAR